MLSPSRRFKKPADAQDAAGNPMPWVEHRWVERGRNCSRGAYVSVAAAEVFRRVTWGVTFVARIAEEMDEESGFTEDEVRAGLAELYVLGEFVERYDAVGGEAVSLYRGKDG